MRVYPRRTRTAIPAQSAFKYLRRWPKTTALHTIVRQHLDAFLQHVAESVTLVRAELQHAAVARRSTRTGGRHWIGGALGTADQDGDIAQFMPWLRVAERVPVVDVDPNTGEPVPVPTGPVTVPGLESPRCARLMAVVVTRERFWKYSGFAVVKHSSANWRGRDGKLEEHLVEQTRGLNRNHNHTLPCSREPRQR